MPKAFDRPVRPLDLFWMAVGGIVCMAITVAISTEASDRARMESDRKLCASVASDVQAYLETPPVTVAGINQLRTKQELLQALKCPDGNNGKG